MRVPVIVALALLAPACEVGSKSAGELESSESEDDGGPGSEDGAASESDGSSASGDDAGSCDAVVSTEDYDRSCTQDSDCVAVFEGEATNECRECAGSAINAADLEAYDEALGPLSCSAGECGADCIQGHGLPGVCVDDQCEIGLPFVCGDDVPCNAATGFCIGLEPGSFECIPLPEACIDSTDCACLLGSGTPPDLDLCVEEGSCDHDGTAFRVFCPDG